MAIQFTESNSREYKERTIENASADITLAFAVDFSTRGEKLTKSSVEKQRKIYCALDINDPNSARKKLSELLSQIKKLDKKEISINIAGNGIYTLKKYNLDQETSDYVIMLCLSHFKQLLESNGISINLIRSGGQTGADESGAKAGLKLYIPTLVHCPKDWLFRDESGDIRNEAKFKARFEIKKEG